MRGVPIPRSFVVMMHNGIAAIDYSAGVFLDIRKGEYFEAAESDVSHRAQESDLDWLKRLGHVDEYDALNVYFNNLPEYPHSLAE